MLWSCLYLPRLPLDALADDAAAPTAVVVSDRGRRRLLSCNAAALARGIVPGVDASAGQALAPDLRLLPRSPDAERAALEGVAAWAYQFTDRLVIEARETADGPFAAVLAEIEGSLNLFGGLAPLRERMATSFVPLGYVHRFAIAPTPAGAEALARAGDAEPVRRVPELLARLDALPLAVLDLPAEIRAALQGVGLRTAGECLRLPCDPLARRFGPALVESFRRLTGEQPDPRPLYLPPPQYRRRFELVGGVDSVEALMFPLKRLLLELEGILIARDTAVLSLSLELEHEGRAPTVVSLGLAGPRRDAPQLLTLLRERLDRITAPTAEALVLRVDEFAEPAVLQHDLFDERARRDDTAQQVVERLVARLGAGAVHGLAVREDHRPEASFGACRAGTRSGGLRFPPRPLWLLREPRPLREAPPRLSRPERIESGWWDGRGGVARDYYIAETPGGSRLWVFRESDRWYLHGIWA